MRTIARIVLATCALGSTVGLLARGDAAAASGGDGYVGVLGGWTKILGYSPQLVGRDLNGTDLNGETLEGRHVLGVRVDEGSIDGRRVAWLDVEASRFTGRTLDGHPIHTKDLAGAILVADLDDGSTLPLHVTEVWRHPDKELRDVFGYRVWFETQEGFEPLCGYDDEGEAALAIPLPGRWDFTEGTTTGGSHIDDPQTFTFACDGYVIAKCVLAGYKPWTRTKTCHPGQGCTFGDLSDHHQACTRALRADYFGDGTTYTSDDTVINLYDDLGVRLDGDDWPLEAEWDAEGARCLSAPRDPARTGDVAPLYRDDCGQTPFVDGALLVTELEPVSTP